MSIYHSSYLSFILSILCHFQLAAASCCCLHLAVCGLLAACGLLVAVLLLSCCLLEILLQVPLADFVFSVLAQILFDSVGIVLGQRMYRFLGVARFPPANPAHFEKERACLFIEPVT